MPQPNMKKQYRAELKTLRANKRKILADRKAYFAKKKKELGAIEREIRRAASSSDAALNKLMRRIAILEGRLS